MSKAPLPEHRFLWPAELTSLADAMATERDRMMTLLLGWTGLRFGEAIALTRGDVDVLRRRINVSRAVVEVGSALVPGTPKSHAARRITFPTFLADDLAAYMATLDGDLLFPNDGGWIRNTSWRRRVFDVTAERLRLTPPTLRVHDLRHTAASLDDPLGRGREAGTEAARSPLGGVDARHLLAPMAG